MMLKTIHVGMQVMPHDLLRDGVIRGAPLRIAPLMGAVAFFLGKTCCRNF